MLQVAATTLELSSGRHVPVHRAGATDPAAPLLVMHYGTPHTGRHPASIDEIATRAGVRLLSVTRAGFPGAPRQVGRSVADSVADVAEVLRLLGEDRVMTAGYSGGGPHALALAARLTDRVSRVLTMASPAPYDWTPGWFMGMAGGGAGLRAALQGAAARERVQRDVTPDPARFSDTDRAALSQQWADIGLDAEAASSAGCEGGEVDDDVAFVQPWGTDLGAITARVTIAQGTDDRIVPSPHATRLAELIPTCRVRMIHGAGHVSVLDALPEWLEAAHRRR